MNRRPHIQSPFTVKRRQGLHPGLSGAALLLFVFDYHRQVFKLVCQRYPTT